MRTRKPQIDSVTFLKHVVAGAANKGTLEDVGRRMSRDAGWVSSRLSKLKKDHPSLASLIDNLELQRAQSGRRKIEEKTLEDILRGIIG